MSKWPLLLGLVAVLAAPRASLAAVLIDQPRSTTGGPALLDQDFEAAADIEDTYLADNFTNTTDWSVGAVFTQVTLGPAGTTLTMASALHWAIYRDDNGKPAGDPSGRGEAPVWSLDLAPADSQITITNNPSGSQAYDVMLTLTTPVHLPARTWWLVFYPSLDYGVNQNLHWWDTADTANAPHAMVVNPGGGAFPNATNWTAIENVTWGQTFTQRDLAFRLEGTVLPDTTPNQFAFTDQTGVARNTVVTSAPVTISGIVAAAPVRVFFGEYQIDSGAWTSADGSITNGQQVKVRHTSSNDYASRHDTILTINGIYDTFSSTTVGPAADVLWHQPGSTVALPYDGAAYLSQDFEAAHDGWDLYVADNFTNAAPWYVTRIFVPGVLAAATTLDSATSLVFQVYSDNGGKPSGDPRGNGLSPVWQLSVAPTDSRVLLTKGEMGNDSDVTLTLAAPQRFAAGTWWLVFYARMDYGASGYAYYRVVADTNHAPDAQAMNPSGGFAGFATTWAPVTGASTWGLQQHDFAFRVDGYVEDTLPDQFTFIDQTGVATSTVVYSNTITVSGINAPAAISIIGGEYKVNGGGYGSASGTVMNGDQVTLRQTSSASLSTTTDAVLAIGGVTDTFSVTTVGPDVTPDQFAFTDQTDVPRSSVVVSNTITVTGINASATVTISGGEYKINGGTYTSTSGSVTNNDQVTVRQTSSASFATTTDATLTVGTVSDTFSVTTVAQQDAGVQQDAGAQQDGGTTQQDGGTAQQDGGTAQQDGGAPQDGGGTQQDAATTPDGGVVPDDGGPAQDDGGAAQQDGGAVQQDAGHAGSDAGTSPNGGGGCGCRTTGGSDASPAATLLLLVLGLAILRRRR